MIMAILGFVAPFLPDLLGFGKQWLDHKQEVDMMKLRHEQSKEEFSWRLDEAEIKFQQADISAARRPHKSYGIKMLDKAEEAKGLVWPWSFNIILLAFSALDWLISFVRPAVSYWAFGLYTAQKTAQIALMMRASDSALEVLASPHAFTKFDQDILVMILGFWFGDRVRRRAKAQI